MDRQREKREVISGLRFVLTTGLLLTSVSGANVAMAESDKVVVGEDDFKQYCAACHGVRGSGDGPVAVSLKNSPTDLTTLATVNGGRFPKKHVRDVVQGNRDYDKKFRTHGPSDMPVWGNVFLDDSEGRSSVVSARINNIIGYIESIQK